jgi:hemin uptake protein HemP
MSPASAVSEGTPVPPGHRSSDPPVIDSAALFGRHVEVVIEHHAQRYRLRQTSLGKLILTK